ncbi:hypothetical protein VpasPP24_17 [Vibrio phage Vpas_PP24]|nr:hypothetical protein VpasPP24_17 [Vibrio phage Vpas_PP24]
MSDKSVGRVDFQFMYRNFDEGTRKLYIVVCPIVNGVPEPKKASLFKCPRGYVPSSGWICTAIGALSEYGIVSELNISNIRPVKLWSENNEEYRLKDQQARDLKRIYDASTKESNLEVIDQTLAPIKRLYNSTNAAGKSALIALVINRLTK